MLCRDMRTPRAESAARGPVTREIAASTYPAAMATACGSRTRGAGRPETRESMPSTCFERQILTAQNVALADAPALGRQQMTRRGIFHRDKIQSRIHVGRHAAIQKIHE